jgi:hypothetical protein
VPSRLRFLPLAAAVAACVGPPAPDVDLCRDVIVRLCATPVCDQTTRALGVDPASCEATLVARTGCKDDFAFTTPTKNRWLECRASLVRASSAQPVKAPCDAVAELFSNCPDVVGFLNGQK